MPQLTGFLRQLFERGAAVTTRAVSRVASGIQAVYCGRDERTDGGIIAQGVSLLRRGITQDWRSGTPGTVTTHAVALPATQADVSARRSATHAAPDRSFLLFPTGS